MPVPKQPPILEISNNLVKSYTSKDPQVMYPSPVNEYDLKEEDKEKVQQWEQCSQVHTQQENNLQVNTFPHQLIVKEERHEDHEVPIIMGQPCLSTASCVLDMGKGTLELSVKD